MDDDRPTAADTIPGYSDFLTKLTKAMEAVPPAPIFAQSSLFPSEAAWKFTHDRQDYLVASKSYWDQVPAETVRGSDRGLHWLGGIAIVDVDDPANREMRNRVMSAFFAVLDTGETDPRASPPLPDTGLQA